MVIGLYGPKSKNIKRGVKGMVESVMTNLIVIKAVILVLLVIGGIERNPGPLSLCEEDWKKMEDLMDKQQKSMKKFWEEEIRNIRMGFEKLEEKIEHRFTEFNKNLDIIQAKVQNLQETVTVLQGKGEVRT